MIDVNSETWQTIERQLKDDRLQAINLLVKGQDADKQRGRIEQIDKTLRLKSPKNIIPVDQDHYN